jgi:ABC-2 type transport system ATP-binding protein
MGNIIEVREVSKSFGDFRALKGVSLSVPENTIFGLLGPNGAGKTTLIRMVTQITAPDTGTISFDGDTLRQFNIKDIGYLPEERGLYRKMKVGEQALYLTRLKGLGQKEAQNNLQYWFDRLNMSDWWNKKVESLSKGMQQKLQFVITVAHNPKLLILDEPFSGFDPIHTEEIKQQIFELREKGTSIIFSTHNMASVEELCENICLINHGEILLNDSIENIKNGFSKSLFQVNFNGSHLAFANALGSKFEIGEIKSSGNSHSAQIKGFGHITTNALIQSLVNNVELISFNELLPSMHDIFIDKVTTKNAESDV